MADLVVNNGITLQLSFEDFILLPLFIVLIFLSLRICIKKLKKKQSNEAYKCPNKNCIRCKGNDLLTRKELVVKLDLYTNSRKCRKDSLSRLRTSILKEKMDNDYVETKNQCPTVLFLQSLVPAKPVHSVVSIHDASSVLGISINIEEIKEELFRALEKDYLWSYNEVNGGIWKLYYFYNQGQKQAVNCDNCPKTTRMISKLPNFMKKVSFGNAAFSFLSPGTNIGAHYGSTNIRLRCHITLQKGNNCTLSVGDEKLIYEDNQVILFDDSFEHSVIHGKEDVASRIILMLDLWHPDIVETEREAIEHLFPSNI